MIVLSRSKKAASMARHPRRAWESRRARCHPFVLCRSRTGRGTPRPQGGDTMRKLLAAFAVATVALASAMSGVAHATGPSVGSNDDKVTGGITYVRHDGGTDASIQACNDKDPAAFGAYTQNNEPFSVVDPSNPNLVITGWNDYCSDWMGLGFSTDAGQTWTDSLVPGYPADTSTEGMASPEFLRTNTASDPVGAFDAHGHFYF